jgi:hypothetical protein
MAYFKQDGGLHSAPITRIICDKCAGTPEQPGEVPFEMQGYNRDGTPYYMQARPWKWAPWAMGQPCDGCGGQ